MATKKKSPSHAKERKYTSKQGHEQAYKGKRKSRVVTYKEQGGELPTSFEGKEVDFIRSEDSGKWWAVHFKGDKERDILQFSKNPKSDKVVATYWGDKVMELDGSKTYAKGGVVTDKKLSKIEVKTDDKGVKTATRTITFKRNGKSYKADLTVGIHASKKSGWFERWYEDENGNEVLYQEGGLMIEGGKVVDYDGVYELPKNIRPLMSKLNLNAVDVYAKGGKLPKHNQKEDMKYRSNEPWEKNRKRKRPAKKHSSQMAKGGKITRNKNKNDWKSKFDFFTDHNETPVSKGTLIDMAYGSRSGVDTAIPQSMWSEVDNTYYYVYDYNDNSFGELVDLRMKLKHSNEIVNVTIVQDGVLKYDEDLPNELQNATFHQALDYVFKNDNVEAFDIGRKSYAKGGSTYAGGGGVKYSEMPFEEYHKEVMDWVKEEDSSMVDKIDYDSTILDMGWTYGKEPRHVASDLIDEANNVSSYAGGGEITKQEIKRAIYEPSGDFFIEKDGKDVVLHLTSKDASDLPKSLWEKYIVTDNGTGYYGSSYRISSKIGSTYAKGGSIGSNWFTGELSFLNW